MPKDTTGRLFGQFASGVLDGFVAGRKMKQEDRAEARQGQIDQRSAEVQQAELKTNALQQAKAQAELDEFNATKGLREAKIKAETAALNAKDPMELRRAKVEEAQWQAKEAEARSRKAQLELEEATTLKDFTDFLNRFKDQQIQQAPGPQGMAPQAPGGITPPSYEGEAPEAQGVEDTRDMPAVEPASFQPGGGPSSGSPMSILPPAPRVQGTVLGGKRVLTGPAREGSIFEQEATDPMVFPGDVAGSVLPPPIPGKGAEGRMLPILPGEVKKALQSKDAAKAMRDLISPSGSLFGADLAKLKEDDPAKYLKSVVDMVDEHAKNNPIPYKAYKKGIMGSGEEPIRAKVIRILTDPNERAVQNPMADIDAAVSQAVAEQSYESLIGNTRIGSYLSVDKVNEGNIARYNGRLLNQAMDDVFGPKAQAVRFSEDENYTLRQVVDALYDDASSAAGNSLLSYDLPLLPTMQQPMSHPLVELISKYWTPMMELNRGKEMMMRQSGERKQTSQSWRSF